MCVCIVFVSEEHLVRVMSMENEQFSVTKNNVFFLFSLLFLAKSLCAKKKIARFLRVEVRNNGTT